MISKHRIIELEKLEGGAKNLPLRREFNRRLQRSKKDIDEFNRLLKSKKDMKRLATTYGRFELRGSFGRTKVQFADALRRYDSKKVLTERERWNIVRSYDQRSDGVDVAKFRRDLEQMRLAEIRRRRKAKATEHMKKLKTTYGPSFAKKVKDHFRPWERYVELRQFVDALDRLDSEEKALTEEKRLTIARSYIILSGRHVRGVDVDEFCKDFLTIQSDFHQSRIAWWEKM